MILRCGATDLSWSVRAFFWISGKLSQRWVVAIPVLVPQPSGVLVSGSLTPCSKVGDTTSHYGG